MSVSSDGNTLTINWTDSGEPSGGTQTGTNTEKRVAKGPAGGNLISGSWRTEKANASAGALTWTYKMKGNELAMNTTIGQSYTAKLLSQGVEKCAKKFGEEAVEAALVAVTGDRQHLAAESADVR